MQVMTSTVITNANFSFIGDGLQHSDAINQRYLNHGVYQSSADPGVRRTITSLWRYDLGHTYEIDRCVHVPLGWGDMSSPMSRKTCTIHSYSFSRLAPNQCASEG